MAAWGRHQIPTSYPSPPGCVIESLLAKERRLWEWSAQSLRACNQTSQQALLARLRADLLAVATQDVEDRREGCPLSTSIARSPSSIGNRVRAATRGLSAVSSPDYLILAVTEDVFDHPTCRHLETAGLVAVPIPKKPLSPVSYIEDIEPQKVAIMSAR